MISSSTVRGRLFSAPALFARAILRSVKGDDMKETAVFSSPAPYTPALSASTAVDKASACVSLAGVADLEPFLALLDPDVLGRDDVLLLALALRDSLPAAALPGLVNMSLLLPVTDMAPTDDDLDQPLGGLCTTSA
jgi:hypothetical protein